MRLAVVLVLLALTACTEQAPAVDPPRRALERVDLGSGRALVLAERYPPRLLVDEAGRWTDVTPEGLRRDVSLQDVATSAGRAWALVGDCAMGRASLWLSDDDARSWDEHDLPMGAHCSAGSFLRLVDVDDERATLDVSWGAVQQVNRFRTTDAGRTWTHLGCRYERPASPGAPCDG